jgi:hypothetical protein
MYDSMRTLLLFLLWLAVAGGAFLAGVWLSPRVSWPPDLANVRWPEIGQQVDYWANRYQTFLGVLVAMAVAYFTLSATGKQTAISERQFLSGQVQGLLIDQGNLQLVASQLKELGMQKVLFENNIAFLDNEGDKSSGWLNANQYLRTAFVNVEAQRTLISQNTAKFLGPASSRTQLIAQWDALVASQEPLRKSFVAWAELNRTANADPSLPAPPEKAAYMDLKQRTLVLWDRLKPLSEAVADDLARTAEQTAKDIEGLRRAIQSKEN